MQRGQEPQAINPRERERRLLAEASAALRAEGVRVTAEALAERLDRSERTVRRWQQASE